MKVKVNIINMRWIIMSEVVTVPSLTMMTSQQFSRNFMRGTHADTRSRFFVQNLSKPFKAATKNNEKQRQHSSEHAHRVSAAEAAGPPVTDSPSAAGLLLDQLQEVLDVVRAWAQLAFLPHRPKHLVKDLFVVQARPTCLELLTLNHSDSSSSFRTALKTLFISFPEIFHWDKKES